MRTEYTFMKTLSFLVIEVILVKHRESIAGKVCHRRIH